MDSVVSCLHALVDLGDVCFLTNCGGFNRSHLQLYDVDGQVLGTWASELSAYSSPPLHTHTHRLTPCADRGATVQYLSGHWLLCRDTVCHLARRDRILRCPSVEFEDHHQVAVWGAEGHEWMCIVEEYRSVSVWELSTQAPAALVYTKVLDEETAELGRSWWRPEPQAGALFKEQLCAVSASLCPCALISSLTETRMDQLSLPFIPLPPARRLCTPYVAAVSMLSAPTCTFFKTPRCLDRPRSMVGRLSIHIEHKRWHLEIGASTAITERFLCSDWEWSCSFGSGDLKRRYARRTWRSLPPHRVSSLLTTAEAPPLLRTKIDPIRRHPAPTRSTWCPCSGGRVRISSHRCLRRFPMKVRLL